MRRFYIVVPGLLLAVFVAAMASMHSTDKFKESHVQLTRKAMAIFPGELFC